MKAFIKGVNFGVSLLLILAAIAIAYIAIPAFGNKALIVRSGSMQPTIKVGDLVVVQTQKGLLSPQSITINKYKEGDIVAFSSQKNQKLFTTHRIVGIEIKDGKIFYQTKGDANNSADNNLVAEENIVGKSTFQLPYFGRLFAFAKSNVGFPLLVIFPALLVIILEIINIYKEIRCSISDTGSERNDPVSKFAALRILIPFVIGVMVIHNAFAYFSDTETSTGNIFQAAADFCNTRGEIFAAKVVSSSQGDRKDGSNVLPERSDPSKALGSPDGIGSPASGFFSLGFADAGEGIPSGSITLEFGSFVKNGDGADLSIHEITNSRNSYPLEKVTVEVSANGTTWHFLGNATSKPDVITLLDFSANGAIPSQIKFVRITDITDPSIHSNDADGFDLDSVDAKYGCTDVKLKINEFVANPETTFTTEWVEIYNLGATVVSLSGWTIKDAVGTSHSLTSLGSISPLSFKTRDIAEGFLNNTGGDTVKLVDPSSTVVDSHTYSTSVANDQSIGRDVDGTGIFKNCTTPTKGTSNNGSC